MYRFGAHTGNQYVRDNKGKLETLLWVAENADSTRGFGYAGATQYGRLPKRLQETDAKRRRVALRG
ncbi:MAG: hypothetical protein ACLUKN_04610 [Bacilli bacterium]